MLAGRERGDEPGVDGVGQLQAGVLRGGLDGREVDEAARLAGRGRGGGAGSLGEHRLGEGGLLCGVVGRLTDGRLLPGGEGAVRGHLGHGLVADLGCRHLVGASRLPGAGRRRGQAGGERRRGGLVGRGLLLARVDGLGGLGDRLAGDTLGGGACLGHARSDVLRDQLRGNLHHGDRRLRGGGIRRRAGGSAADCRACRCRTRGAAHGLAHGSAGRHLVAAFGRGGCGRRLAAAFGHGCFGRRLGGRGGSGRHLIGRGRSGRRLRDGLVGRGLVRRNFGRRGLHSRSGDVGRPRRERVAGRHAAGERVARGHTRGLDGLLGGRHGLGALLPDGRGLRRAGRGDRGGRGLLRADGGVRAGDLVGRRGLPDVGGRHGAAALLRLARAAGLGAGDVLVLAGVDRRGLRLRGRHGLLLHRGLGLGLGRGGGRGELGLALGLGRLRTAGVELAGEVAQGHVDGQRQLASWSACRSR